MITVLTSLSPDPASADLQRASVASWRAAGAEIVALQTEAELRSLGTWADIAMVASTGSNAYGGRFIPISRFMRWATANRSGQPVLLLNSDCRIVTNARAITELAARAGLVYLQRHDARADGSETPMVEGIDGFIFDGAMGDIWPESERLVMGKPAWDYALPLRALQSGRTLWAPAFPTLLHTVHPLRWSDNDHTHTCREAARITGWNSSIGAMLTSIVRTAKRVEWDGDWGQPYKAKAGNLATMAPWPPLPPWLIMQ